MPSTQSASGGFSSRAADATAAAFSEALFVLACQGCQSVRIRHVALGGGIPAIGYGDRMTSRLGKRPVVLVHGRELRRFSYADRYVREGLACALFDGQLLGAFEAIRSVAEQGDRIDQLELVIANQDQGYGQEALARVVVRALDCQDIVVSADRQTNGVHERCPPIQRDIGGVEQPRITFNV